MRMSLYQPLKSVPLHRHLNLLLICIGVSTVFATAQSSTLPPNHAIQQTELPAGWKVFPTPAEGSDVMHCANFAQQQQVSLTETGVLHIVQLARRASPIPPPELPAGAKLQQGMFGHESILKTSTGWLLGFDGGEFGGGLWFVDVNGNASHLYQENVHGFVETSRGVMVFVGVAHMTIDRGEVLIAHNPVTADTKLEMLVPLDGAPETFTKISPDAALVVTTHGISRISISGDQQSLTHSIFAILYPKSIVVTPDASIYVGMRLFVVRLVPTLKPGDYTEQWLVPADCEQFHMEGYTCSCSK
jgi:hypothetical protein